MRANGAWDKALKPEKLGILSNAETKLDVVNAMADLMETTPGVRTIPWTSLSDQSLA